MGLAEQVVDRRLHIELAAPRLEQRLAHALRCRLEGADQAAGTPQHGPGREVLRAQKGALAGVCERSGAQVAGELPAVKVLGRGAQLPRQRTAVIQRAGMRLGSSGRTPVLIGPRRPVPSPGLLRPGSGLSDRGGRRIGVLTVLDDALQKLIKHLAQPCVRVTKLHAGRQRGLGRAPQIQVAGVEAPAPAPRPAGQVDDRDRATHRRSPAHARVSTRRPREPHGRPHEAVLPAAGDRRDDRLLLDGRLIPESEVLEAVTERLRQVPGGDVLRGILRRNHPEALVGVHGAEVRHLHHALVERRQQQVLRRLRQAVQLVEEEDAPLAHGAHQRTRHEGAFPIPEAQHERRVEPACEPTLGEAVVAVHTDGAQTKAAARGERQRGLAAAHRAFQQKVASAAEHGTRGRHLTVPADHASDGTTLRGRGRHSAFSC